MPVQCTCARCGSAFVARPSDVLKRGRSYCSKKCGYEGRLLGEQRICRVCGAAFYRTMSALRKGFGIYCSTRCCTESQRNTVKRVCMHCGASFIPPRPGQRLCSLACAISFRQLSHHWNWKGGVKKRDHQGPEYRAWRIAVFERDGYVCRICGDARGGNLRAHHIRFWAAYPALRFDVVNGLTTCERCHRRIHAEAKRMNRDYGPVLVV